MLSMADGPPPNLPNGQDAYGGYVNDSGIGVTWPQIQQLAAAQHAIAFSFTTNGSVAQCADVENGAMSDWLGYWWGYCSVSNVNANIAAYGRPQKLLTAHHNDVPHICSPRCWPGLVTTADGTQWTDHGGMWDQSMLSDDFFDVTPPLLEGAELMDSVVAPNGDIVGHYRTPDKHLLEVTRKANQQGTAPSAGNSAGLSIIDITNEWPQFQVEG